MLILSQHKIVILNFNTTTTIIADKNEIIARLINGNKATLGKYATEERAKEVLREIIKCYRSYLQLNGGPAILQGQMDIQPNIFNIPKVYEMPEE